jgi:hypothetical protein
MYCDGCAKSEDLAVKAELENLALRAEISNARQVIDGLLAYKTQAAERHQKDLDEIAELKRKLAEAEAKLASCLCWESEHCPLHSIGIAEAEARVLEQRCRAEAAERELAEAEARSKEEKGRRQAAEADLRKTEEHRLAAVAQSVRYERKCAELSEALRWMDRKGGLGLDVHERIKAALQPQPAPEPCAIGGKDCPGYSEMGTHTCPWPKPEMSAEEAEGRVECHGDAKTCNHPNPTPEAP